MIRPNNDDMLVTLDEFGESYEYPVYVSVYNMSDFLSSRRRIRIGYAAVTHDGGIIFTESSFFREIRRYNIPKENIMKVKVKKALFGGYRAKIEFLYEGKKKRCELTVTTLEIKQFPDQAVNSMGFINAIQQ